VSSQIISQGALNTFQQPLHSATRNRPKTIAQAIKFLPELTGEARDDSVGDLLVLPGGWAFTFNTQAFTPQ
jgi:hypothetical protein